MKPIVIKPPGGQLRLSSRRPKRKATDTERDAQGNRDRVNKSYRLKNLLKKASYRVIIGGEVINMLVRTDWLDEDKTTDRKAVEQALSCMLEDAAKNS